MEVMAIARNNRFNEGREILWIDIPNIGTPLYMHLYLMWWNLTDITNEEKTEIQLEIQH